MLQNLLLAGLVAVAAQDTAVVLTHVSVVSVDRGVVVPDVSVVIEGDRIREIGAAGVVATPSGARVIDAGGGYLIPGLWDMHVHALATSDPLDLQALMGRFLAHGVTGLRDMGSHLDTLRAVRAALAHASIPAPRIVASGPLLDGSRTAWSHPIAWHLEDPDSARVAVGRLRNAGVDFLKVYNRLPREAYLALADEASRQDLTFGGHLPFTVSSIEAAQAGQRSFEHGSVDLTAECAPDGRARFLNGLASWGSDGYAARFASDIAIRAERDPECLARILDVFRDEEAWLVPTMVLELKDQSTLQTPAIRQLSDEARGACESTVAMIEGAPDSLRTLAFDGFVADQRRAHEAGVRMLAGTDFPNPCIAPGASLLDELELLTHAGMTPVEALRAATLSPAEFLGLDDELGRVAPGMIADLVLLEADPLSDISNVGRIRLVIAGGRVLNETDLRRLRTGG